MPCQDISEYLELELDADDRLRSFSLRKGTCGADVGDTTLPGQLHHATVAEIMARTVASWSAQLPPQNRFLREKQLNALQAALAVYVGEQSGAVGQRFAVHKMDFGDSGVSLSGYFRVDIPAQAVPACRSCACSKS